MSENSVLKVAAAQLLIISGELRGQSLVLDKSRLIIGRELDCGLRLSDARCSRHHAALLCDDFAIRVRDLGSTNGTLVNGQKIETATVLNENDEITIGDTKLLIRRHDGSSSTSVSDTVVASADQTTILF